MCAGEATRLVSGGQVVAGRKLSFINDVAVTQDGKKLYFTDSSSRWQRRDYLNLIMEATADGRYHTVHTVSSNTHTVFNKAFYFAGKGLTLPVDVSD